MLHGGRSNLEYFEETWPQGGIEKYCRLFIVIIIKLPKFDNLYKLNFQWLYYYIIIIIIMIIIIK